MIVRCKASGLHRKRRSFFKDILRAGVEKNAAGYIIVSAGDDTQICVSERMKKMDKVKKKAVRWLLISIAVMLVSAIAVSCVQTDLWRVSMKELFIETDRGYTMSAYLFVPKGVSAEHKAPAVVTSHGFLNNKEMQDANYVELARRGFIVMSVDQPDHGDSDVIPGDDSDGIYQGVLALSRMPFVDKSRIGVTGHSMGGSSCNRAVASDNAAGDGLISAVLLNCMDAVYTDENGSYVNVYGGRDVGMVSAVYDEFCHMYTDENGVDREAPYFMEHSTAQSFLNFGRDPSGLAKREAGKCYHESIGGKDAIRVIYRPAIIHPWSHFSARSTSKVIEFFTETLEAPKPIASGRQVWQVKELFNFIGLLGFASFIGSFGITLLFTKPFESLRAEETVQPAAVTDKKEKRWFWLSLCLGTLFSMIVLIPACGIGALFSYILKITSQLESLGLGLWSTFCGLFVILMMAISYRRYGRKNGFDLAAAGVKMPAKKLWLSVLLGLIIAVAAYTCVFIADYFFFADFRIWTLAIKAFEAPILKRLPFVLLFFTFYIANSVASNCFNYNTIGKSSWGNTLLVSFMTALPAILLPAIQYTIYFTTKKMLFAGPFAMPVLWLFPIFLILFGSTVISRAIYRVSKNPYIAGVANAVIVGILTITNTCTMAF